MSLTKLIADEKRYAEAETDLGEVLRLLPEFVDVLKPLLVKVTKLAKAAHKAVEKACPHSYKSESCHDTVFCDTCGHSC